MKFRKSFLKGSLISVLIGLAVIGILFFTLNSENEVIGQNGFNLDDVAAFSGEPYAVINGNVPYFTDEELTARSFETYSPLDSLGRCGVAMASIGLDLMPSEERGEIGRIHPSGWYTIKYDCIDGKYLYNRCHLIGYQLSGENANERNLITGTRYLNVDGMLQFENLVADFVRETEYHVMYRVTPIFTGDDLLARGVLMEARSVEDGGEGVEFCVFCYNAQPCIEIDYATGESRLAETYSEEASTVIEENEYVLNTNSKKFHKPDCSGARSIKADNREEFVGTRNEVIAMGYEPCGKCQP